VLVPEQAVALVTSPGHGRRLGRSFLEHYLDLPNYANNLRRLGFTDEDLADGGSDRLVDALVAWGDEARIAGRVREHLDAGADSVCLQVLTEGGMVEMRRDVWRQLAPALTAL
jgi:probable F420-dependent oxidoreductase